MDFASLLQIADENKKNVGYSSKNFLSTKVSAAKKDPKQRALSSGIQKFLAKQEAEKKLKAKDDAEKKRNLLELRNQDKKSKRAANSMLKMTKSSNKSAIAEAKNSRDTEATLAGRSQCDEDDYGYESQTANSYYEKLLQKYERTPTDPMAKFSKSGLKGAKDVAATLNKVKDSLAKGDESFQPFRRPSSRSSGDSTSVSASSDNNSKEKSSSKKFVKNSSNAPAPPNFAELLKMAEKKKNEPVNKKELNKNVKEVKEAEFHRPMTAKEKAEFIRERNSQLRKMGKLPPSSTATSSSSSSSSSSATSKCNPSSNDAKDKKSVVGSNSRLPPNSKIAELARQGPEFHPAVISKKSNSSSKSSGSKSVASTSFSSKSRPPPVAKRPRSRSRSPSPIRHQRSSKAANRIESDEEEYDSEMDDFIDDSDCKMDVSAEIGKLFGYNRHKYRDDDFDDRSMENNSFASQMREEQRSARIGLQEDLEDMRREEEEKKRKRMIMKKRR